MAEAAMDNEGDALPGDDAVASPGVDWTALTNEMQSDTPDLQEAAAPAPVDNEAPKEEEAPATTVEAAQETPPAPPETVVETKAETPAETKEEEKLDIPPVTEKPEIKVDDFAKLQENFIAEAAKQYELTDEQVGQYLTEPNKVLPQLAARVQETVTRQVLNSVAQMFQQHIPQFVEHQLSMRESVTKAEDIFFSQWQELKPHKDRVMQIASVYRQLNPNVDAKKFMQDVGMQAWMAVGLPVAGLAGKLQAPAAPAATPAPVAKAPVGLVPANPNGRAPAVQNQPSNPWAELAQEIIQTER